MASTTDPYGIGAKVTAPIFPGEQNECIVIERSDSLVNGWFLLKPCQLDDYGCVKVSSTHVYAVR